MNPKRIYRKYDEVFKKEAVNLVLEQGYSVADAARINTKDDRGATTSKNKNWNT